MWKKKKRLQRSLTSASFAGSEYILPKFRLPISLQQNQRRWLMSQFMRLAYFVALLPRINGPKFVACTFHVAHVVQSVHQHHGLPQVDKKC